jgi:hypothetical protein
MPLRSSVTMCGPLLAGMVLRLGSKDAVDFRYGFTLAGCSRSGFSDLGDYISTRSRY